MKKFLALCAGLCCAAAVYAQSASYVSDILGESEVTWQSMTYLAYFLDDSAAVNAEITPQETFDFFASRGLVPPKVSAQSPVRYDTMSDFLLESFGIPRTSFLYRWFGTPRYALRQMQYYGILRSDVFPADRMNGSFFITIVGNFATKFPNLRLVSSK